MRTALRFGSWLCGLAAVLVALLVADRRLPSPPFTDPSSIWAWINRTEPMVAAFTLLRLIAIVVVVYLLATTALVALAHAARVPALIRASSPFALPAIRRLAHGATSAGLAVTVVGSSTVLASASPAPPGPPWWSAASIAVVPAADDVPGADGGLDEPVLHGLAEEPVLVDVGATPPATAGTSTIVDDPTMTEPTDDATPWLPAPPAPTSTAPPVLRAEPGDETVDPPATPPPPPPDPTAAPVEPRPSGDAPAVATCTIVAGDHLWGVAARTLAAAWGRPPGAASTAGYLEQLIGQNRSVLVVAGDPDLILPGQVFTLPAIPSPPGG